MKRQAPTTRYDLRGTREEIETRRKAFIRKCGLITGPVAEASMKPGDALTFTLLHRTMALVRTTNAIELAYTRSVKRRSRPAGAASRRTQRPCCSGALLARQYQRYMRKVYACQSLPYTHRSAN